VPYFCVILILKTWIFSTNFSRAQKIIKDHKNQWMGAEVFIPRGRADGRTAKYEAKCEYAVAPDYHYNFKMKRAWVILTLTFEGKLFCLRTQSLPYSKHSASRLQKPSVNAVYGYNGCLFWDPYKTHKYTVCEKRTILDGKTRWYMKWPIGFKRLNIAEMNNATTISLFTGWQLRLSTLFEADHSITESFVLK
jgi:hypothetical protein